MTMTADVHIDKSKLAEICRQHHVRSLALFGSALGHDFDPQNSDLDFLVDFEPLSPVDHADAFFELMDAISALTGRYVDLVERQAIRNPFFLRAVNSRQEVLYATA
jgi:uncharacterized protein